MKVRITLTVEVNPDTWEQTYGVDKTNRKALREDVVAYCLGSISESAAANEGAMEIVR